MTRILSAFMVPFKSFVKTNIANIAVKQLVTMYSDKEEEQQHKFTELSKMVFNVLIEHLIGSISAKIHRHYSGLSQKTLRINLNKSEQEMRCFCCVPKNPLQEDAKCPTSLWATNN